MQFRYIGRCNRTDALFAEERIEEQFDRPLVFPLSGGLTPYGGMFLKKPRAKLLHGRRLAQRIAGECRIIAPTFCLA